MVQITAIEARRESSRKYQASSKPSRGVVGQGVGHDPEQRHDHHHGDVVGPLSGYAALDLDLPDVVEGVFDRAEDTDYGPEEHDQRHGGHHAALRAEQGLLGEPDDVVDDLGVLREEFVEVLDQPVGQPEALDDGEHHGDDRHERHERVEGQRRAADDRSVLLQPPCRVKEQAVLLHEPPHDGIAPFVEVAQEDRVGEVCQEFPDFHVWRGAVEQR